ncbi:hypothetical protein V502_10118, partial [Pseudogymnoascus sp. VKM F-4520 (FW-2644)]
MAGKGKKGKSKGGNKPKAASQAPKQTPAVESAAAAAATNSSTPIESELITPGALDLKITDPEVAAVAGEAAEDKEAAAAAPAAKAVEKEEAPVAAAEKKKEEPVIAETKKEEPIVAKKPEEPIVSKKQEEPIIADKQRDAPIAADKQQKDAPIPAAVGAQKDVESKQAPTIGGASAAPLAAGVASTKSDLLANNNPFIAKPAKETNPFDTPAVAAPVKDIPTPASKTEAFKDVPIQSKETAPAPKVQQPEANVPTHKTPFESTTPYTQPLNTTNEAVAQPEQVTSAKKVAADGFEPAPVAKPTSAAATEPYPAPSAVENLKRAIVPEDKKSQSPAHTPLPTPSEYAAPVTETTPYQPPAPAAAVPQQTSAPVPAPSQPQATTTTTGTAGGV